MQRQGLGVLRLCHFGSRLFWSTIQRHAENVYMQIMHHLVGLCGFIASFRAFCSPWRGYASLSPAARGGHSAAFVRAPSAAPALVVPSERVKSAYARSVYVWGQALAGACGRRLEGRHLSTNYTIFIHTGSSPAALSNGGIQAAGGWLSPSAGIHLFYTARSQYAALLTHDICR